MVTDRTVPYSNSLTYSHTPHLQMLSHLKIQTLSVDLCHCRSSNIVIG